MVQGEGYLPFLLHFSKTWAATSDMVKIPRSVSFRIIPFALFLILIYSGYFQPAVKAYMYTRWWYSFVPIRMHMYFYPIYLIGLPHLIFSLLPRRQAFPLAVFSVWLHGNIFWCAESSFLKNLLQPWQGCCSFRPQDGAPTWRGDARVQMRRLIKPN